MNGKIFRKLVRADISIVKGLSDDIRAAVSLNDKQFIRFGAEIFLDTIRHFNHLIDIYFVPPSGRQRMSGPSEEKGRPWFDGSPPEIVENMKLAIGSYEMQIEELESLTQYFDEDLVREIDRERIQLLRKLAFTIQVGKKKIEERYPGFWSPELDHIFREWLDFKLS